MDEKQARLSRVLDLYIRLQNGAVIRKTEEAVRSSITPRTVQRDIDDLRAFLADHSVQDGSTVQVVYDKAQKGFVLKGQPSPLMSNSEIFAVSKILLESRAFSRRDLSAILEKLVAGCLPPQNRKRTASLLANEAHHYVELTAPPPLPDTMWDLAMAIQEKHLLKLHYQRQDAASPQVTRVVEPLSILFSEYYFYLNAYLVEQDEQGVYRRRYDSPAVFRIDRIRDFCRLSETFRQPYAGRFQEGEFRKRVQFMYSGQLQTVRFRYTGPDISAILDRLPTASVTGRDGAGVLVEAEVSGRGILMWLLGQGDWVEVLSPDALRQEMRDTLARMLARYQGGGETPAEGG